MKKMKKLLGSVLLVAAVVTFASCSSSDDEEEVITDFKNGIVGTWEKVNPQDVQDAGYVTWTFHPNVQMDGGAAFGGNLDIFSSDWAAGDTTIYRRYGVYEDGQLSVWTNTPSYTYWDYTIVKMTADKMVLNTVPQDNTAPTKIEFRRK